MEESTSSIYYDDGVINTVNSIYNDYLGRLNIFGYLTIVSSFGSSIGASLFYFWPSIGNVIALIATILASVFILNNMYKELKAVYATTPENELDSPAALVVAIVLIITALLYPHIAYILEAYRGILTRDTYDREDRCPWYSSSTQRRSNIHHRHQYQ
jgi:hypothetical protein